MSRFRFVLAWSWLVLSPLVSALPAQAGEASGELLTAALEPGLRLSEKGNVALRTGNLYTLRGRETEHFVEAASAILGVSPEDLVAGAVETDELGHSHVRLEMRRDGLPVRGASFAMSADAEGSVYWLAGVEPVGEVGPVPVMEPGEARSAAAATRSAGQEVGEPELTYLLGQDEVLRLAWEVPVTGTGEDGVPIAETVYVDAATGEVIETHSRVQTLFRQTWSAANGTWLPGPVLGCQDPWGCWYPHDIPLNAAFGASGVVWDFYRRFLGRNSWNGWGAPVVSTVHYGHRFNDAFWNGGQMVFGDGDGQRTAALSLAFDIVAHEFTHGVTQTTAGLIYSGESGALNEATSDIMAAAATLWFQGVVRDNVWMIGEEVFTPGVPGDAARYMHDPTRDGISRDWYPWRYLGPEDFGGVHWNSGIANLAYKLLVTGGSHPRGLSGVWVPPVGLEVTRAWYRALLFYLPANSTFRQARWATAQAAWDLFGAPTGNPYVSNAVHAAWDAVGVPR